MARLAKFEKLSGANYLLGNALFPHLRKWGADQAGRIVLDVGCGESPFAAWFASAERYVRVDRSPADPEVIEGDACNLPIANDSVDCMLLFQVLSDVPEPTEILSEARRVLRPGGVVLIFETMSYPEHDLPHDYYRILPQGLEYLAKKCGLTTVECVHLGGAFSRMALFWNVFVMGSLRRVPLMALPARGGIMLANLVCGALDRLVSHPVLATDYWAVLKK